MTISIPLSARRRPGPGRGIAIVDDIDRDLASSTWAAAAHGRRTIRLYAVRTIYFGTVNGRRHQVNERLHRLVLERALNRPIATGCVCDHINGNSLDNRRCNLREVSQSDNCQNRRSANANSGTGVLNVSRSADGCRARVSVAGTTYSGPARDTVMEAAQDAKELRNRHGLLSEAVPQQPSPTTSTRYTDGRRMKSDNTSGFRGVSYRPNGRKWHAYACDNGKHHSAGLHDTPELAAAAAHALRVKLGLVKEPARATLTP